MTTSIAMPWSDGERAMQELLRVPHEDNPTSAFLTPQAAAMFMRAPLLALATLDSDGRPWATIWGGEPGFSQPLGGSLVGTRALVDKRFDPVAQALVDGRSDGEVVKEKGRGRMLAGLPIDLVARKRVKVSGRMVVASLGKLSGEEEDRRQGKNQNEGDDRMGKIQLVLKVEQSLGNCPKYINSKTIIPAAPRPELAFETPNLSPEARALIAKADMFFISSYNGTYDMDINHRGGPAGFVRIVPEPSHSTSCSPTTIVYPEYSGNRYYQTLGNFKTTPLAGLCFPDFTTGDVLYLTGTTRIYAGAEAAALLPRSNLAVAITITASRFVRTGLSFRGTPAPGAGRATSEPSSASMGMSPYNPPVRLLAAEGNLLSKTGETSQGELAATLTRKEVLTPSLARFTFALSKPTRVLPGQWVALDASDELDIGYSHMRDDDPASLNDDFVRTFTVTSAPAWGHTAAQQQRQDEEEADESISPSVSFTITARRHGPVTGLLFAANERAGLSLAVRGFGGEFRIKPCGARATVPFVAGGVGITPLLAELAHTLSPADVSLFWTLRAADAALVVEVFERYPALARGARIFLTGGEKGSAEVQGLEAKGASVAFRRLEKGDLVGQERVNSSARWYLCAGRVLRQQVLKWLGRSVEVLFEEFSF